MRDDDPIPSDEASSTSSAAATVDEAFSDRVLSTTAEALEILGKITRNLLLHRTNPKYRRLKGLENTAHSLWRRIGRFPSALRYLEKIGFRREQGMIVTKRITSQHSFLFFFFFLFACHTVVTHQWFFFSFVLPSLFRKKKGKKSIIHSI